MKTKVVCLAAVLFLSVAHATDWSTNLPCFYGGAYDGWDRNGPAEYQFLCETIEPSSATFSAHQGAAQGEIVLTWDSPGNNGGDGNFTGS